MAVDVKDLVDSGYAPSDFVTMDALSQETTDRIAQDMNLQAGIDKIYSDGAPIVENVNLANGPLKFWTGMQDEYDAIPQKDTSTIYFVMEVK